MKRMSLAVLLFANLVSGCDGESSSEPADAAERGPLGKHDRVGSCQPDDCGGPASEGACWCDEACLEVGDCCSDFAPVCGSEAPHDCNDGSALHQLCDIPPVCEDGLVKAIRNSCFACVDPQTCEPPEPTQSCNDGSDLNPLCDIPPVCEDGLVKAIRNSCFACVDPQTCAAP